MPAKSYYKGRKTKNQKLRNVETILITTYISTTMNKLPEYTE